MNGEDKVRAWDEEVSIPTYEVDSPNPNPMFLEKRVYQGSSGVVYPYPIIDKIFDEKHDKRYQAVFLENEYVKVMLLPELGGRIQYALDKTNNSHFVYYNKVIKPSLVGLTGPWISGGIEFNWPQHHRPSTFDQTDYKIESHSDGSMTVWIAELERMFRTKAVVGFRLYPGCAHLELNVRLYNGTTVPQTFLWWANPAVSVDDDYESVFPPDVHAVMDHGKRDVSEFPIARGTYYKVNYAPGTDISKYKNIPVPTSFMAYKSDFDFLGYYNHGSNTGMLHVANHHLVPGKKQWTWGTGDFGLMWERQLTDDDGPYVELMCGAFTDNQPDFSWLMPGEQKQFSQYFLPYKDIGPPCNASKHGAIRLSVEGYSLSIGVYSTFRSDSTAIKVMAGNRNKTLFECTTKVSPDNVYTQEFEVEDGTDIAHLQLVVVFSNAEKLSCSVKNTEEEAEVPQPATAARKPAEISSNEELFLNGQHLEQYRHATYSPEPYYMEAIQRDPEDSRCNNALGLLRLRQGKFQDAEEYIRTSIRRLTSRNPNPYDGEPYYNLGLCLKYQGNGDSAYCAFYKATWNDAWQSAAFFELARLECCKGKFDEARNLVQRSLDRNMNHHKARHLLIAISRNLEDQSTLSSSLDEALRRDPLDLGAMWEGVLLGSTGSSEFRSIFHENVENYIELALDYADAGLYDDAEHVLSEAPNTTSMVRYYQAWIRFQNGNIDGSRELLEKDQQLSACCFPNRVECVPALQCAIRLHPSDNVALYLLGNFWYSRRQHQSAIECWEESVALDDALYLPWRNLGLAYMNKKKDAEKAMSALLKAFQLAETDSRVFFELDQLRKIAKVPFQERFGMLEENLELVLDRDDFTVEYLALLNLAKQHKKALDILTQRKFHPWEGGEGKVARQFVTACVELARSDIKNGKLESAKQRLLSACELPCNLGEANIQKSQINNVYYYLGIVNKEIGDLEAAKAHFELAAAVEVDLAPARYYNDLPPEVMYFKGLALQELGEAEKARILFRKMVDYCNAHLDDIPEMDYFAVSLPDFLVFDSDLSELNKTHCLLMQSLGLLGQGFTDEAKGSFQQLLESDPYHLGILLSL